MVAEGNCGRRRVPSKFREIKCAVIGICARHKKTFNRVTASMPEGPCANAEIPRVFFEQRREYTGGHKTSDRGIAKTGRVTLSIALPSLSPGFIIVAHLCDRRQS